MSFLNWLLPLFAVVFINLLSFTDFFGTSKESTPNGQKLTRNGKIFLAFGIVGILSSVYSTISSYDDDNEEKQRIIRLEAKNDQLKTDISGLKALNDQLKTDISGLKALNQQLKTDISGLKALNQQLKTDISGLSDKNDKLNIKLSKAEDIQKSIMAKTNTISDTNVTLEENSLVTLDLMKEQESNTRRYTELAEKEAKRREICSNVYSNQRGNEYYMKSINCSDYYQKIQFPQQQVISDQQYNYSSQYSNPGIPRILGIPRIYGYGYNPLQ